MRRSSDMKKEQKKDEVQKYLEVILIDFEHGTRTYHNVKMIRLKGKDSNLLIMVDYMPVIGELHGRMTVVTDEDEIQFLDIKGFYMLKNNVFKLLIRENDYVE